MKKYPIDHFSEESLEKDEKKKELWLKFHDQYFRDLHLQRKKKSKEITESLISASIKDFQFSRWVRCSTFRWSQQPLLPYGSLKQSGGRFNIPEFTSCAIPSFCSLYIGENDNTAEREAFQGNSGYNIMGGEDSNSLESRYIVYVNGYLKRVIDLNTPETLKAFLDIIKQFNLSDKTQKIAYKLGCRLSIIDTLSSLLDSLLEKNWSREIFYYEVPSNSQIFGYLLKSSGIDGIIYPSKFETGNCIAIFPDAFTESFVNLADPSPSDTINRIDVGNWSTLIQRYLSSNKK